MEREYERSMVSILVANYLHDARIVNPTNPALQIGGLAVETLIDGDIPVRIEVQKESSEPAWIRWHLWSGEPGRRTWGTMSVGRLSVSKAILVTGSYDRSCKRSPRLAKIPQSEAKWGLSSTDWGRLGIETTS